MDKQLIGAGDERLCLLELERARDTPTEEDAVVDDAGDEDPLRRADVQHVHRAVVALLLNDGELTVCHG